MADFRYEEPCLCLFIAVLRIMGNLPSNWMAAFRYLLGNFLILEYQAWEISASKLLPLNCRYYIIYISVLKEWLIYRVLSLPIYLYNWTQEKRFSSDYSQDDVYTRKLYILY